MQGLTVESLSLSPAEQRAYPRWYTDLLLRKRHDTVAVGDLLRFVDNFGISDKDKQRISAFLDQPLVVIEPAQFYVFLRLCGHLLQGQQLRRELAYVSAPVPKPKPILSKRKKEDNNPFSRPPNHPKSEMDSFMSLMAGPSGPSGSSKKHRKRVTFDEAPPSVAEAAQRSMQELMRQQALAPQPLVSPQPQIQPQPQQEQQEQDVPIPQNHFTNVNIESVLHHGHSSIPEPPPPRKLTPNTTGPGEMIQMGVIRPGESLSNVLEPQSQASLQNWYLQAQGTGNASTAGHTIANTMANAGPALAQPGPQPTPFSFVQPHYNSLQVPQHPHSNSPSPVLSRPQPPIPQFQSYQPTPQPGQWQPPPQQFQTYPQQQNPTYPHSLGQQFQNLNLGNTQPPAQFQQAQNPHYQTYGGVQVPPPPPRRTF